MRILLETEPLSGNRSHDGRYIKEIKEAPIIWTCPDNGIPFPRLRRPVQTVADTLCA